MVKKQNKTNPFKDLPVAYGEDVEFSRDAADEDDLEALERADAADHRAEEGLNRGE
ncbi:YfhD family protein [Gorillibacterium massiliense]|uniref:YfhD family protein n=1 Tax=Gorillibacterium massiliense TaxID=1280390 RepID=UPI0004B2ED2F|nr:YfhD family protein [Gorillibacterium massiliense]